MGSKARHSKEILSIILSDRKNNQLYIEPFCGGCNTLSEVSGNRLGSDIDPDLIVLWDSVSKGWLPPENISEKDYNLLKKEPPSPLKGYAAFALSFGGKKFGGWRRGKDSKGFDRNYSQESFRNAKKQFPKLFGVNFCLSDYRKLRIPKKSLVYCDPPYFGTTQYESKFDFDHMEFFNWCRKISKHSTVYVSEYSAPKDFECVWEKKVPVSIASTRISSPLAVEKLFKVVL